MSKSIAYTVFDAKIVFLKTYVFFLMVKITNPYGKNENEILCVSMVNSGLFILPDIFYPSVNRYACVCPNPPNKIRLVMCCTPLFFSLKDKPWMF